MAQHYSGNVRELRNLIERAITLSDADSIEVQHLQPSNTRNLEKASITASPPKSPTSSISPLAQNALSPAYPQALPEEGLEQYLEKVEKEVLINALNLTHWNRTLAAKKLGMTFRSLRYRLKKFGLDTEE